MMKLLIRILLCIIAGTAIMYAAYIDRGYYAVGGEAVLVVIAIVAILTLPTKGHKKNTY